ncbi:MAG: hypothetical protein M1838_006108 [Thelocarpon superellum]|nr:MAG: hypothetical protein M1838_006108 [Thelocarpon superellum]
MSVQAKVKETVVEEAQRVRALSEEAARSGAFLYPLKGIAYFFSHRSLWQPLLDKLIPTITTAIGVVTFMFVFTYLPQAAVLTLFNGPLAAVSSVFLVLSESSTLITIISKNFLIEDALLDTFDGTLVAQKMTDLVSEGRQIHPNAANPIGKLGKLATKPLAKFAPQAIIRYFLYLPLNFIPVVGTILFLILQGRRAGEAAHTRYFQLKGMGNSQKRDYVSARQGAYTSFGLVSVLLELVPVASILFSFTNTVAAALWAADLERQATTAPKLKEQAHKAE